MCCARFRVTCDDSDWIRHPTQICVAERHLIRIRMVPDNNDRVKVIVRWIQKGRILVCLHTDPFRHVNVHKLPFTTENWELWKGRNKSPNGPVTALKTRPVTYMRNVLEAFQRNFYWQILCTPGLFYGKFKSVTISKSLIYTYVLGKYYCFRLLVAQSRQTVTLTSLLQGNNVCAKSCNVLAKQERTGIRRCLKGKKKQGKILLKYIRNFSCEFG